MPQSMAHMENLVKRYGDLTALNHLELDIREGEIFGLLLVPMARERQRPSAASCHF